MLEADSPKMAAALSAMCAAVAANAAVMLTPWGEKVTDDNAWRLYPRPQMVRSDWTCGRTGGKHAEGFQHEVRHVRRLAPNNPP